VTERNTAISTFQVIPAKAGIQMHFYLHIWIFSKRERNIINLYYLEGYKDEEIAAFFDLTRQAINYIRKKGINKLKIF